MTVLVWLNVIAQVHFFPFWATSQPLPVRHTHPVRPMLRTESVRWLSQCHGWIRRLPLVLQKLAMQRLSKVRAWDCRVVWNDARQLFIQLPRKWRGHSRLSLRHLLQWAPTLPLSRPELPATWSVSFSPRPVRPLTRRTSRSATRIPRAFATRRSRAKPSEVMLGSTTAGSLITTTSPSARLSST